MLNNEELEALKNRVRRGNELLNLAWVQLKAMDHTSQFWKDEIYRWFLANEELSRLCTELKASGFKACLYLNESGEKTKRCLPPGDDIGCRVCPSMIPYWQNELMKLPSPKVKPGERGKDTMEFIEKLGEEV